MKKLLYVGLVASLALNALLLYFALGGQVPGDPEGVENVAASGTAAARPAGLPRIDARVWPNLQTNDLPVLINRLREAGFPKEMIRAIMSSLLDEQFAARRKALDPDAANRPFWKNSWSDPKYQLAMFKLSREEQKSLEALLGPDARTDDPMTLAQQRAQFGNISAEKMDAVQRILRDASEKRTEFYYTNGNMNMADNLKLQQDQRTALAQVLSPAEMQEYDLRNSQTARSLRESLTAFNATEAEYRLIYNLRQPFDELYPNTWNGGPPTQQEQQRRAEAEKQLNDQIAAALGPDRTAEYQRSTDYNYRRTDQLVARLELPPETTLNLWNIQQDFQKQRMDIYQSTTDPAQRTQQLTALQQAALAKVTPILGANGTEAYKQYGGTWIASLVPRPPVKR